MREPSYNEFRLSLTAWLLIVNGVVYAVQCIASGSLWPSIANEGAFALSLEGLTHGFIWQLLTFQFMHASPWHILFNAIAIYFFGRPVETAFGGRRFLTLYLCSGVIGGLVQVLCAWLSPDAFGGAVVGASAGGAGLVAAFALLHWTQRFTLFLYFVPVPMTGRTLFWGLLVLAAGGMAFRIPNIANAAHLGGVLAGLACTRHYLRGSWLPAGFPLPHRRPWFRLSSKKADADLSGDDFVQQEVDPILEKISAQGIHSLTASEREILEKARAKMTGK
ncbi:MAG: rhomboid family intramembrane serine protease [Verrucomicrobiota bacterium]|nr:rhomboid family intramembrane serine protease [Verrucomicrobiota bacterium]